MMTALLRELLWPAAAGNVFWAFFTLVIKGEWTKPCGPEKIFAIFFMAIYLVIDWLWTTKNNITTTSSQFYWVEYPFLAAIVAFAIATQEKCFPQEIAWSEISLVLAFSLAAIGHGFGFWTSIRPLSPPQWFSQLSWVNVSPSAYTRGVLVIINLLGIAILLAPRNLFGYPGCWHLSLAIGIPFALWCAANWNSTELPGGGKTMSYKFECREARPEDIDAITCLAKQLASETEGRALEEDTIRKGIKEFVTPTDKSGSTVTRIYVAQLKASAEGETSDTIIGYLTIAGAEWSDWDNGMFLWLGSSYVPPNYRNSGVAKSLYNMAIDYAKTINAVGLRAYVLESNKDAKQAHQAVGQKLTQYKITENQDLTTTSKDATSHF